MPREVEIVVTVTRTMSCDACERTHSEEPETFDYIPDEDEKESLYHESPGDGWYFLWSHGTMMRNEPWVICPHCADRIRALPEDDDSSPESYWRTLILEEDGAGSS